MCVCARARARVCERVCVRECECMYGWMCVRACVHLEQVRRRRERGRDHLRAARLRVHLCVRACVRARAFVSVWRVCVRECECVRVRVCAYVRVLVSVCVRVRVRV